MGHKDLLTICDAGFPIPMQVERIDLALTAGIPSFVEVVKAVADDLQVEQIILAEEIRQANPQIEDALKAIFDGVMVGYLSHEDFKKRSADSRAIIRTGECSPFANVILVSGVTF